MKILALIIFLSLVSAAQAQETIIYENIDLQTVKSTSTKVTVLNVRELLQKKENIEQAIAQMETNYIDQKLYLQNKLDKVNEILATVKIPKEEFGE